MVRQNLEQGSTPVSKDRSPKALGTPIKLPELSRAGLLALYSEYKAAERLYQTALNSAVMALGIDPREDNRIDLDTGIITPVPKDPPN